MKKLISCLLCVVLMFSLFTTYASAQKTNLCENFRIIEWFETCFNKGTKNNSSFGAEVIYNYVAHEITQSREYEFNNNITFVPEAEYEAFVNEWFKTSSSTFKNLQALKYDIVYGFPELTDSGTPVYSGGEYCVILAEPMGDQEYYLDGYLPGTDKYFVYLNKRTITDQKPSGTENKDYFTVEREENTYYTVPTNEWMQYTVTYNNSKLKYVSTDKVTSVPEELIRPGDIIGSTSSITSSSTSSANVSSVASSSTSLVTSSSNASSSREESSLPSVIEVKTIAKISGAELCAAEGVFPQNTAFSITRIDDGISYESVKSALDGRAKRFTAFNITAAYAGMPVQPNGTVTAIFEIPEGYEINKLAVIYISDDGKTEQFPSIVDKKANTITVELFHFSTFAVVEMINETNVTVKEDNTGLIILVIVLIVLLLAGIGFLVWFFFFYRKKVKTAAKKPIEPEENDDDMLIFP